MNRTVRAFVFDLGNTLWFEAVAPDLDRIFAMQAIALAPLVDSWQIPLREPLDAVAREIWHAWFQAERTERERASLRDISLPFLIRGALAVRDIDITQGQAEAWWRTAQLPVREFGLQLYPDTIDVLRELKSAGMRIGINTTRPFTGAMMEGDLRDLGFGPYIDLKAVVCSGDTGYVKPHPSTFELVLSRLGVAAEDAVMVGDDAAGDMRGGRQAGMATVWKLNGRYDPPPCPEADYQIHDLAELLSLPLLDRPPAAAPYTESLTPHEDANAERY
ncbi:MAG: HAD family hydrolase [Chloroflexota bacterium]|nr:HAD family hydrolase [Chloroflexota bacterium]